MPASKPDPSAALHDEADIGSGEKTPAQLETEELIRQIPPLPPDGKEPAPASTPATPPATAPKPGQPGPA